MSIRENSTISASLLLTLALSGCGGGGGGDSSDGEIISSPVLTAGAFTAVSTSSLGDHYQIDATAGGFGGSGDWTYIDLDTMSGLDIRSTEAATDSRWDIAFRRTAIRFNSGPNGPGQVTAALIASPEGFYDADGEPVADTFTQATAESYADIFNHAVPGTATTWLSESEDVVIRQWYTYNPATHTVTANPDRYWLVRGATGDRYARIHVTDIRFGDQVEVDIELWRQPAGTSQLDVSSQTTTLSANPEGGDACLEFATGNRIDCNETWDLRFSYASRSLTLHTNGGISGSGQGGAFEITGSEDTWTSATTSGTGQPLSGLYSPDQAANIFSTAPWYAYNLGGQHKIWSNFRVYGIDTDGPDTPTGRFRMQIISYYNDAGTSAMYQVRIAPITEDTP
ncbi:HmuY family protein [Hahella sp. SMD15-11]|uniref:HmuY family protein n=1 Tax=Thermohahella caldifontis TaxID=3142973 RepID=A0AB39USX6_9GAMM